VKVRNPSAGRRRGRFAAADGGRLPPACPARRALIQALAVAVPAVFHPGRAAAEPAAHPDRAWYLEARRMRDLAVSWGDQSYGAVVVAQGKVIGQGPSRVVKDADPQAHAERVAIRQALQAHGGRPLVDAVLYSTSRPCAACERAAAQAGVLRMYWGPETTDAGAPQPR
jgi:tRNA(Arg) A34 adenosine deaminase TadA